MSLAYRHLRAVLAQKFESQTALIPIIMDPLFIHHQQHLEHAHQEVRIIHRRLP